MKFPSKRAEIYQISYFKLPVVKGRGGGRPPPHISSPGYYLRVQVETDSLVHYRDAHTHVRGKRAVVKLQTFFETLFSP
jgi:hypothetical protein